MININNCQNIHTMHIQYTGGSQGTQNPYVTSQATRPPQQHVRMALPNQLDFSMDATEQDHFVGTENGEQKLITSGKGKAKTKPGTKAVNRPKPWGNPVRRSTSDHSMASCDPAAAIRADKRTNTSNMQGMGRYLSNHRSTERRAPIDPNKR
jgi:hypothetical protein